MSCIQEALERNQVLHDEEVVIVGDFNAAPEGDLATSLQDLGFQQLVHEPTHDYGHILDHVYIRLSCVSSETSQAEVVNTYYSDHDLTVLITEKGEPSGCLRCRGHSVIALFFNQNNSAVSQDSNAYCTVVIAIITIQGLCLCPAYIITNLS